jgi:hypothetical protein
MKVDITNVDNSVIFKNTLCYDIISRNTLGLTVIGLINNMIIYYR